MLRILILLVSLHLSGCTTHAPIISPETRTNQAMHLAKKAGFKEHTIHTELFTLKAYGSKVTGKILTIYIEGDGLSWISGNRVSDNPTPVVPMGLKMAINNKKNNPIVYLARPCQFVFNQQWKGCQPAYWTNLRFSSEVVNAMNQAVTDLKEYYHAKKVILIGYSGGGTIAALLAARRDDVIKLITIAAVLDMKQWQNQKSLSPLNGSLDPADVWENLVSTPQTHWVGGKDTIVPKEVAFAFASHFPPTKKPNIIVISDFDHSCCWATL